MKSTEVSPLLLQIEDHSWPLKNGDVVGRHSTIGGGALRKYDVLSREHLKVQHEHGRWQITLMPSARNVTLINGAPMAHGIPQLLTPATEVLVDNLRLRFRLQSISTMDTGAAPVPAPVATGAQEDYPMGLVVLDELFVVQSRNEFAARLFDPPLKVEMDFVDRFETAARLQLRHELTQLQEKRPPSEITLPLAAHGRWLSMIFHRVGHQLHGALRDSTKETAVRQSADKESARLTNRLKALETILLAPAFRSGDLPACLPLLAQHAANLLGNAACSFWLEQPDGQFRCTARFGFGTAPKVGQVVGGSVFQRHEDDLMGTDPAEQLEELGMVDPKAGEVMLQSSVGGGAIYQRPEEEWTDQECVLVEVFEGLFRQALSNAERGTALQKLQVREAALESELAEAARYVERLLPEPVAEGPLQMEWNYHPCGQLGGDVFGYEWLDDRRFAIYVMDVVGHGTGSSLLAVSIINRIRVGIAGREVWVQDPAAWLRKLNDSFPMEKHGNLTWTMWCGIYDRGTRILRFASGGHPPALLVTWNETRELTAQGVVLGAMPEVEYSTEQTEIPKGAKLFVCTDGAYEFPLSGGKEGTFGQFAQAASDTLGMKKGECDFLYKRAVFLCTQPQLPDDCTILCARFDVEM